KLLVRAEMESCQWSAISRPSLGQVICGLRAGRRPSERTRNGRKRRPGWRDSVSKRTNCVRVALSSGQLLALYQGEAGKSLPPGRPPTEGKRL
uniref:Uncharacterized protein n=1 Tax=Varanus komodoensis TaxID=61221 RepID=A0A8D2JE92_VARKO